LFATGLEALNHGDLATARTTFEALVTAQPQCAEAHNNLAVVLVEQGEIETAAEHLRRALELRPDYQRARLNLKRIEPLLVAAQPPTATPTPTPTAKPVRQVGVPAPPTPPRAATPVAPVTLEKSPRTPPLELLALEPVGVTACVIDPAAKRICVYRRTEEGTVAEACYTMLSAQAHGWPPWLVTSDWKPYRIRLVDERGRRRLRVIPEGAPIMGDAVTMRPRDFEALNHSVIAWRTGWLTRQGNTAVAPRKAIVAQVHAALEHWRRAWAGAQYDEYERQYDSKFVPQSDADSAHWRSRKRELFAQLGKDSVGETSELFAQMGKLSVELTAPSIFLLPGDGSVMTSFEQSYRAGPTASHSMKVMRWQPENDSWRITVETVLTEDPLPLPAMSPMQRPAEK